VFWPNLLETRECLELSWTAGDAGFFGRMMLARLFPSVKDRFEIRRKVVAALEGRRSSRVSLFAMMRVIRKNQGAKIVPKRLEGPSAKLPPDDLDIEPESWTCDAINASYMERFFQTTARHGIRVVWLIPPVRPDLQELRERNGLDRRYKAFACRFQQRHPHVTVVDGTRSGYAADVFIDGVHLDRDGALALSTELAPILLGAAGESAGGGGWVRLPSTRTRPADVVVEDFGQSVEAVLRIAERRRGDPPGGARSIAPLRR
jgi:hypothetical protein